MQQFNDPLQMQYNDPGNSVYLLYQKEVYNCDHSFLQSLMDWLYSSNESPFKFIVRNKALIKINRYGIIIQKENNAFNINDESNWTHIHFNLKHLKEIYVDKRHKDTCVLVSKVSQNSCSNYVWKKTNPSNYQSFRSPYGLNNAFKKAYLLTIIKFKDGPSKLLQTIQLLDSILADYNKQEDPKLMGMNPNNTVLDPNSNTNTMNTAMNNAMNSARNKFAEDLANYYNSINMKNFKNFKVRPNVQQYFNDAFIKSQQQQFLNNLSNSAIFNHCANNDINNADNNQSNLVKPANCMNPMHNQIQNMNGNTQAPVQNENFQDHMGHSSLRNRLLQTRKRTLSIDNRHNSPLYSNYNNSSNKSLQNYALSTANSSGPASPNPNYFSLVNANQQRTALFGSSNSVNNFSNLSRQGSVNEIRSSNNQVLIVNRNLVPGTGYLANTGAYHHQKPHSNSPNHFGYNSYLDLNTGVNGTSNGCNSPQYPQNTPLIEQCGSLMQMKSSPLSPFGYNPATGLCSGPNNTSNENLSEIGYQQYRKKYVNNLSVSSTSSLRNAIDIFTMKPSIMNNKAHHHHPHHYLLQRPNPMAANASICRQTEHNGSITSMNSGYSTKLSVPLAPNAAPLVANKVNQNQAKKSSTGSSKSIKRENILTKSATNATSNSNDESDNNDKKETASDYTPSKKDKTKNETNSVLLEEKNITMEKGEDENVKSKMYRQIGNAIDYDDNEESTVTIVEEINYKETKSKRTNNKSEEQTTTGRDISVDTSLRKIPAKVLLDMLKSENDSKSTLSKSSGIELQSISNNNENISNNTSVKKFNMDTDFLKKNSAEMSPILKDELNSLNKLKESNKVRDIINSFNNFEKNNNSNNNNTSLNEFNSKRKFFTKFNTINISNLGKPPPPVKKFNNPNNKLCTSPATAAATLAESQENKSNNENSKDSTSLSFHLNGIENKKQLKSIENNENELKIGINKTNIGEGSILSPMIRSSPNTANKKGANNNNNGNIVIINNITTKGLMNTENFLNKFTDSIIKSESTSINNDINIINTKLAKIVNMLNNEGATQNGTGQLVKLKKTDNMKIIEQQGQNGSLNGDKTSTSNELVLVQPQQPPAVTTRKRTFANMVWPMDPEEEKILRSCSPYEVPEVIVQRNDSVKSILKKNNFIQHHQQQQQQQQQSYNASPNYLSPNPDAVANSKKRVDFQENCCFINFFEIHEDELVTTSS